MNKKRNFESIQFGVVVLLAINFTTTLFYFLVKKFDLGGYDFDMLPYVDLGYVVFDILFLTLYETLGYSQLLFIIIVVSLLIHKRYNLGIMAFGFFLFISSIINVLLFKKVVLGLNIGLIEASINSIIAFAIGLAFMFYFKRKLPERRGS